MAKKTQTETKTVSVVQEEVKNEVETQTETKEQPKKAKSEPDLSKMTKLQRQRYELMQQRQSMKKICLMQDTPYVATPKANSVAGVYPKGTICYVEDETDDGMVQFYKVGPSKYINKSWNVKIYD